MFASSNLPNDRLGEILLREGKITVEEYETSIKAISKGKRQGKVLVEMGALSPQGPLGGRAVPGPGDRLQRLPLGRRAVPLRGVDAPGEGAHHRRPRHRRPDPGRACAGWTPTGASSRASRRATRCWSAWRGEVPASLEPYESHVLRAGGRRAQRARDLPRERDRRQRDAEGALRAAVVRPRAGQGAGRSTPSTRTSCPRTPSAPCSTSFNQMYGYVFRYMVREVGPIAENVLEKYLGRTARGPQGRLRGREAAEGRHPRPRGPWSATSTGSRRSSAGALLVDGAERAALRRAAGRQAHPGRRARGEHHQGLPGPLQSGAQCRTRQQIRGAVILLALALLYTAWRLWRLG